MTKLYEKNEMAFAVMVRKIFFSLVSVPLDNYIIAHQCEENMMEM